MRRYSLTKIVAFTLVFGVTLVTLPYKSEAATKPYFKSFGEDAFTGGWFTSAGSCSGANYQAAVLGNNYPGGILSFAKSSGSPIISGGGASSQYGAFALGFIEGDSDPLRYYGLYSNGATAASGPTRVNISTFANNPAISWGGVFSGTGGGQAHCVPDYFGTKQNGPTPDGGSITPAIFSGFSGQYLITPPVPGTPTTINALPLTLSPGQKVTIFVDGDAYIPANIIYSFSNVDNIPKFALVVKGNIYIAPAVSRLDGLYIAQPDLAVSPVVTGNTGIIWTCHDSSNSPTVPWVYPAFYCKNKLTLSHGALIAKQINFTRVNGDATTSSTSEDNLSNALNPAITNIAEVINYSPSMAIDGPFFQVGDPPNQNIDSLISLPPVF